MGYLLITIVKHYYLVTTKWVTVKEFQEMPINIYIPWGWFVIYLYITIISFLLILVLLKILCKNFNTQYVE